MSLFNGRKFDEDHWGPTWRQFGVEGSNYCGPRYFNGTFGERTDPTDTITYDASSAGGGKVRVRKLSGMETGQYGQCRSPCGGSRQHRDQVPPGPSSGLFAQRQIPFLGLLRDASPVEDVARPFLAGSGHRFGEWKMSLVPFIQKSWMMSKSKSLLLLSIFPSWIDVIIIILLYRMQRVFSLNGFELLGVVIIVGFIRYLFQVSRLGFLRFSSRNCYIKEFFLLTVSVMVAFSYEQDTLAWFISTYFAEITFLQLSASIFKERFGK